MMLIEYHTREIYKLMSKKSIIMLFKVFERKEYAEQFLNGEIFFNPLTNFTKYIHKERGDRYEGSDYIGNKHTTEIFMKIPNQDEPITINKSNGLKSVRVSLDNNQFKKICCLYAITRLEMFNKQNFKIDKKMLKFGGHVVQIINSKKFLKRFKSKLDERQCKYKYGLVDYVDLNHYSGKWNAFKKPEDYIHQNEFRFMFVSSHTNAEKINLGDISNIAKLKSMETFLDTDIQIQNKTTKNIHDNFTLRELLY